MKEKDRTKTWIDNIGFMVMWFVACYIFLRWMIPQCTITELYDGKIQINISHPPEETK